MSRNKRVGWSVSIAESDTDHEVEVRWFLTYWRANRFWYRATRDLHKSFLVYLVKR